MNENLTRCFIALDLPRNIINEIVNVQEIIKKKKLFDGNLVNSENLHLTLKFLSEIDDEKIEKVKEKLKSIKFSEFETRLGKISVFSSKYSGYIKVLWVELKGKGLFELQKKIDECLDGLFEQEKRFMAHITLARIKRVYDKKGFLEYLNKINIPKISFNIDEFYLKKSELFETGAVYEDLEVYNLDK
ncbi:MAG: RNA 2',3'-cyclic phosphodiesterase [Nanoarchaeota archaeon]